MMSDWHVEIDSVFPPGGIAGWPHPCNRRRNRRRHCRRRRSIPEGCRRGLSAASIRSLPGSVAATLERTSPTKGEGRRSARSVSLDPGPPAARADGIERPITSFAVASDCAPALVSVDRDLRRRARAEPAQFSSDCSRRLSPDWLTFRNSAARVGSWSPRRRPGP